MVDYVSQCRGCALPCLGTLCRFHDDEEVHYCDNCGCELDGNAHIGDGKELCEDCASGG